MRIISWNVNGIRSNIVDFNTSKYKQERVVEVNSPLDLIMKKYNPDIICFSECRLGEDNYHLFESKDLLSKYPYQYWKSSQGTGARSGNRYSGTSIWSKIKAEKVIYNIEGLNDKEGRYIELHFEEFLLINVYTPNSGSNWDYRLTTWEKIISNYLNELSVSNNIPIIYTGDLNVAPKKQDVYFGTLLESKLNNNITDSDESKKKLKKKIKSKEGFHNGRSKTKLYGYTIEERNAFKILLGNIYTDCYRYINPNVFNKFTWFNIRIKDSFFFNIGWRIDHFLIQNKFKNIINKCDILYDIGVRNKDNKLISDHLPILLEIKIF